MKILIVGNNKPGHFAPFVEEQARALQKQGCEVVFFGVQGKGLIGYLRCLPALKRAIQQHQPDLIHAHYGLSGLLANLQRRVPVVTTYHGSDINVPKILRFSRIAMRLSAFNIFVSARSASLAMGNGQWAMESNSQSPIANRRKMGNGRWDAAELLWAMDEEANSQSPIANRLQKRHALLPCGVNIPKPWSELQDQWVEQLTLNQWVQSVLSKDVKNVLFAGAFDNAVKDPELAFAAVALLQTQCSGAEAPVYSVQCKGEETSEAVTSAQTANTSIKLIELKGYNRDQVNALMYNCDALLMTSRTEGSPQVIKEAMACGCPIVSVDVGDVAERVSGVEGCYIVRTREPKDIAEALQRALAFEGKTNGRDRIIEMGLSNEQVAEQLLRIYEQLLV